MASSRTPFRTVLFTCTASLILCAAPIPAADLRLGGHLKSLDLYTESPPASGIPSGTISSNRLRLDLTGEISNGMKIELSTEDQLLYADPAGLFSLPRASVNQRLDLDKSWNEEGDVQNRLFIDRLNMRATLGGIEWTAGRQGIGFGRIVLFSPLDVIAPFPPDALDTDVRPGIDALRAVRYFGLGGQIGAVAVFGDRRENNSYLATWSHNVLGVDLLGLGGRLRERSMAGIGLAGQVGGVGVKTEAAFYRGKEVGDTGGDLHDNFALAGIEADYRFGGGLILTGQYLYNGAGVDGPEDYPKTIASAPLREGLGFLLGRHYLLIAPSYEAHPLVTVSGIVIWNLEDDSFFARPLADISLSDNLALQLFWGFSEGAKPEKVFGATVPRSEFGAAPDSGGVFLKYFF